MPEYIVVQEGGGFERTEQIWPPVLKQLPQEETLAGAWEYQELGESSDTLCTHPEKKKYNPEYI